MELYNHNIPVSSALLCALLRYNFEIHYNNLVRKYYVALYSIYSLNNTINV